MRITTTILAACLMAAVASGDSAAQTRPAPPTLALDHLIIFTATNAPAERAALEQAGFRISPTINHHNGQGASSQTVEFENGFLELAYADDGVSVTSESGRIARERFAERADWRRTNSAPFSLGLVRTSATPATFPFETWRVNMEWMTPGTYMEMLTPRGSRAVSIAIHPNATDEAANRNAIAGGGAAAWQFQHPNRTHRITSLVVVAPDADGLPPSQQFVNDSGAASLVVGHEWLAVLTLDNGAQNQRRDLRPVMPLVIHY